MKKIRKIIITYRNCNTKCPMGTQVFVGSNADVLAANFQSRHPELEETSCKILR